MATKNEIVDLKRLDSKTYEWLRKARWKARTDLGWLCREILGYKDVSDKNGGPWRALHQPIIDVLQKFPVPTQKEFEENDRIEGGFWQYKPIKTLLELPGKRRVLILDPRGFLKSTINSIAHTIQWILNYPDIAILIFMSSDTKAADILGEIKKHFQYNTNLRELFPEHCPTKNVGEWGTMQRFTTEARSKTIVRKEPTVMTGSIEKGAASYHFDIIKFSDIVDENNIAGNGLEMVRKKFDVSINLLVSPRYWLDVEGTRYHHGDVYGTILEREMSEDVLDREYAIHLRSIFKRNIPGGEKYTPEDMKFDWLLDENGKRIPWWPERFPLKELEKEMKYDSWLFGCQKLNWPSADKDVAPFPVNNEFPKIISRKNFVENVQVAYKEISVDFAETKNDRSNYTCITVGTIDSYGRLYIEEIIHGKFLADLAVKKLFDTALKHYRHLKHINIEESSYLRGLMPTINRILDTQFRPKGVDFTLNILKRGNRERKAERIYKSLQPWYKNSDLRFLDDIAPDAWRHLLKEMEEFPNSQTDDILDTIADFLSDKEYFGRERPKLIPEQSVHALFKKVQQEAQDRLFKQYAEYPFESHDGAANVNFLL